MRRSIALAFAACLPALAAAQMYKWVDEKGVTHYSETPPPSGKSETLSIKPRSAPEPPKEAVPAKPGAMQAASTPDPKDNDLNRLAGTWKTAAGQVPAFEMGIMPFGGWVKFSFWWQRGGQTVVNNSSNFEYEGGKGQGRFTPTFPPSDAHEIDMMPTRIDYRLKDGVLEATVTSSLFAGSYRLRQ
jgi:hypothetical protein